MEAVIERFFKVSERGSSLGTEVMAGLTTFLTMAYIVAVNPAMMEAAGIPFNAALTATCFGAAIMTAAMGLIANRPIALASGMGINAIVAYTLCGSMGLDWRIAMGVVFLEGVIIMVLVLMGLREAVMDAIPVALRQAIGIGIGLFVAFIGLKGGGILAADSSTLITMGSLTSPEAIVAIVSSALAIILTVRGTKGGLPLALRSGAGGARRGGAGVASGWAARPIVRLLLCEPVLFALAFATLARRAIARRMLRVILCKVRFFARSRILRGARARK